MKTSQGGDYGILLLGNIEVAMDILIDDRALFNWLTANKECYYKRNTVSLCVILLIVTSDCMHLMTAISHSTKCDNAVLILCNTIPDWTKNADSQAFVQ